MKGLLQIYTGAGKGKTTAGVGLAVRAAGHGKKVAIVQFMKSGTVQTGEIETISLIPNISISAFGSSFIYDKNITKDEVSSQLIEGVKKIKDMVDKAEVDLLILDEINVATDLGLVDPDEILGIISKRPEKMEVVFTGRNAPAVFLEAADLITEMKQVRHPFEKGIPARKGIEY